MITTDKLQKPEQIRAMEMLEKCLPEIKSLFIKKLDTNDMFKTNYVTFFSSLVNLPHGDSWLWNQSNAKVNIELDDFVVLMQKMNTRRRKNGPKAPFYKLWLYSIKSKADDFTTQFVWCEKGISSKDQKQKKNSKRTKETTGSPIVQSPTNSSSSTSVPIYSPSFESVPQNVVPAPQVYPTVTCNQQSQPQPQPQPQTRCAGTNLFNFTTQYAPVNDININFNNYNCLFPPNAMGIDVDSLLWPTYVYSEDNAFINNFPDFNNFNFNCYNVGDSNVTW